MNDPREPVTAAPRVDYGRPVPLLDRIVARLRTEHLAIAITFCGFAVGMLFAHVERHNFPGLLIGLLAVLMILVGTFGYVILRVRSRKTASLILKVQLVLATALCLVGVFKAVSLAEAAGEGPTKGMTYWLTYNQTYAYNPVRVIGEIRLTAIGVAWFAAVATYIALKTGKNSPCPPPSQPE